MTNVFKKPSSFGGCDVEQISPERLDHNTQMLVVARSFEEALKLSLAVDEGLRALNRYSRATAEGKRARLNLHIKLDGARLFVQEGKARTGERA